MESIYTNAGLNLKSLESKNIHFQYPHPPFYALYTFNYGSSVIPLYIEIRFHLGFKLMLLGLNFELIYNPKNNGKKPHQPACKKCTKMYVSNGTF